MRVVLQSIGSLWFAAVLLMLLLVAMACATVYESTHGTERALIAFYHSAWFKLLLFLLGANLLASVVVRYPFSRRQIGFVLTHCGILATLLGALITERFGIDGQVAIVEGQSVSALRVPQETLTIRNQRDRSQWQIELGKSVAGGFDPLDAVDTVVFEHDKLSISALRYVPDGEMRHRIVDDNPGVQAAVEVSLSPTGHERAVWIFAGKPVNLSSKRAGYRVVTDPDELEQLFSRQQPANSSYPGRVRLGYHESTQELDLKDCVDQPVVIGDTGYSFQVLRYFQHATVGSDYQLADDPDQAVNPAIEAEVTGPSGRERIAAFARFPDFQSTHLKKGIEWLKVTYSALDVPLEPLEIISGPDGRMYARFVAGDEVSSAELELNKPVTSPWSGLKLAVLRKFDHARIEGYVEAVFPVREQRQPAMLVSLRSTEHDGEMWLQRNNPRTVNVNGEPFELTYGDKTIPLGFELKLNRFRVGYYPGGRRPRSFESHVSVVDPASGSPQDRVISMNHPTEYGGYTFYQSSYRQSTKETVSILSVSKDPGQLVVFGGYIMTLLGMLIVIAQRMTEKKPALELDLGVHQTDGRARPANRKPAQIRQPVPLQVGGRCQS